MFYRLGQLVSSERITINCFSHCCDQILDREPFKGGRVFFGSQCGMTVHPDEDGTSAGDIRHVAGISQFPVSAEHKFTGRSGARL